MSEIDMIEVGDPLPRLASVESTDLPYTVAVTWAAGPRMGRTDMIDLAPIILTFKIFRPLRDDDALFKAVRLGEWGHAILWDGDDDLDIGADSLEELAEQTMTNAEFAAFLRQNDFTLDAAAAHLGISRRMVAYYAKGHVVPRVVALACKYLDLSARLRREAA